MDGLQRRPRPARNKRETGVRLYEDQIEKLAMIVKWGNGREDRSRLIREGIDMVIAQRLQSIVKSAAVEQQQQLL